jgi:hypothetical protein
MNESFLLRDYFRKVELAAELEKSTRTLDRWEELRIGPPRTVIGKDIFYRRDSVEAWLRSCEQRRRAR